MAGMFYSLSEVAERLNKTEEEVRQMVKGGQLREFRDGSKLLFKKDEIDALSGTGPAIQEEQPEQADEQVEQADAQEPMEVSSDTSETDISGQAGGEDIDEELVGIEDEISLTDEGSSIGLSLDDETALNAGISEGDQDDIGLAPEGTGISLGGDDESEMVDLSPDEDQGYEADSDEGTKLGEEGVKVLGEDDKGYDLTEDTLGETTELSVEGDAESLDSDDVNLESFGSGSGLLDLSLQADDTSLGAVLDDIIPGAGGGGDAGAADMGGMGEDLALADAEEEPSMEETPEAAAEEETEEVSMMPEMPAPAPAPVAAVAAAEPPADASSNAFGVMLLIPFAVLIYMILVITNAFVDVVPSIVSGIGDMIWYIAGGLGAVALVIMIVGMMAGGGSKPKTAKAAKPKKTKAPKAAKAKKPKKEKKKKKK